MLGRISFRAVSVAVIASAAMAATAAAAQAMTVSIGQPSLAARVAVTVPVTVSCSAFDPSLTLFSTQASVNIEQAAGQGIAHGTGSAFGGPFSALLWPCDGSSRTVPVVVLASPGGPPFHGGPAVVSAAAQAMAGISCGFPGCFFNITSQSATAGPIATNLH
jgi:hypothetical protein